MGAIIRLYSAGETWEVPVLFEDAYLLAVDKPSGLPAAPSGPDRTDPSLLGLLHAGIAAGKSWAKERGLRVTCEVTPHHFTLIDEDVNYDSRFKMNPPLASREDREALIAGLADGAVDVIATDHAPHEPALKNVEFDRAPFGILGFETALSLTLEQLVVTNKISLMRMVELFTTGPARVLGIERKLAAGQPADVTLFSTTLPWTYKATDSPSKSRNSPFDGHSFRGAPMATIVAGKIVFNRHAA